MVEDRRQLPTLEGIRGAREMLRPYVRPTPLVRSLALSRALAADVWIKNETASPIACFKLRGALTELLRARDRGEVVAAVTSSTGNHGQGVALAAKLLALEAHVFLPEETNPAKRAAIEALGASLHVGGADIDEAKDRARVFADERGMTFVDDGEGLGVMEGAGTVGLEIAEELDEVDTLVVPVGSGTLAAGSAAAVKALRPRTRVLGVQASGSPAMAESFRARRPVERPVATIADGLACRKPADLALRALFAFVDEVDIVGEEALLDAIHAMAALAHVLAEPAGAAPLAFALARRSELEGRRVVLVVSGANLRMEVLRRALERDLAM